MLIHAPLLIAEALSSQLASNPSVEGDRFVAINASDIIISVWPTEK